MLLKRLSSSERNHKHRLPEVSRLGGFINKRKRITSPKVSRYVRIQEYTGILPDNSCKFFFGLRKKRCSLLSRDIVGSLSILLRFKVLLSYVSLSKTTKPLPSCGLKMTILVTSKLIQLDMLEIDQERFLQPPTFRKEENGRREAIFQSVNFIQHHFSSFVLYGRLH